MSTPDFLHLFCCQMVVGAAHGGHGCVVSSCLTTQNVGNSRTRTPHGPHQVCRRRPSSPVQKEQSQSQQQHPEFQSNRASILPFCTNSQSGQLLNFHCSHQAPLVNPPSHPLSSSPATTNNKRGATDMDIFLGNKETNHKARCREAAL